MFGMGLGEILLVAIIAIVFLGPDKLPEAMVKTAKFFKKIKITVDDAKSTLEEEIGIDEVKKEAEKYQKQIEDVTHTVSKTSENSGREVKDLFQDLQKGPNA
ncbi:MAG: Sec-independent protein translocase protein TatB [Campylobacterales bacterium]|nr:Sec-independent protein translocase protein TatB [Campylobacterales bacterium]